MDWNIIIGIISIIIAILGIIIGVICSKRNGKLKWIKIISKIGGENNVIVNRIDSNG